MKLCHAERSTALRFRLLCCLPLIHRSSLLDIMCTTCVRHASVINLKKKSVVQPAMILVATFIGHALWSSNVGGMSFYV